MSVRKTLMKILWSSVALVPLLWMAFAAQAQNKLTPAEIGSGWLNLFDGSSTYGWDSASGWSTQDQSLSTSMASDRRIVTAVPFADFVLNFEFRLSATPSGAAVRIRAPHSDDPENSGYRITLGDSKPEWPAGSIMLKSKSTLPNLSLNAWHKVSIEANGTRIVVQIDGQQTAETKDDSSKAGYIQFENARGSRLDLRNIYIKPLNINPVFNNTDLSGWKNVPFAPKPGEGMGHSLAKMFSFGSGSKPHTANWSVRNGKIHGENGPGSLETNASYDDFVLQLTGSAQIEDKKKKEAFPAIYLRNEAGSIATGYPLGIGSKAGELHDLAHPRKPLTMQPVMSETVVAGGRVIGIFINGSLETLYTDTRPEGSTTKIGARIKAGTISLDMPEDLKSIDVGNIAVEAIPHTFGGIVHAAAPTPPTPTPAAEAAPAAQQSASIAAQTAQIAAALGTPTPQARQQVAQLMSQALKTDDPQQQMQLYDQVVRIDPNNAAAVQGYKDAAAKAAAQQQQQQQQQNQAQQQEVSATQRDRQVSDSLAAAQSSFLNGDLKQADKSLLVAERLAPDNPLARDLRSRIDAALSLRHRLLFLCSGAGILALFGAGGLFWRSKRRIRFPVLHVVQGIDQGRLYPVDRDVVRIGGIAQDGAQKNDIVIRDVEHMVSRFHCEVRKKDGNFFLIDTNSSNGTKVNGELARPSQPVALRKGAKIDLGGSTVLQFDFEKKKRQT